MATNHDFDDALIRAAQKLGRHRTQKDAVNRALVECIQRHTQSGMVQLFGKIEFVKGYDPKLLRSRACRT